MFARDKRIGPYTYVYLVENVREEGRTKQRIIANLGRKEVVVFRPGLINLQHFCHSRWRNPVRLSKSGIGDRPGRNGVTSTMAGAAPVDPRVQAPNPNPTPNQYLGLHPPAL